MTSPLRRNRPTTARSIRCRKISPRPRLFRCGAIASTLSAHNVLPWALILTIAALGLLFAVVTASAGDAVQTADGWVASSADRESVQTADHAQGEAAGHAVRQASYTSGKVGGKLKWLPSQAHGNRPTDAATQAVEFAAPLNGPGLLSPGQEPAAKSPADPQPAPAAPPSPAEPLRLFNGEPPLGGESSERSQPVGPQELEQQLAAGPRPTADECLSLDKLKRIQELSYRINAEEGKFPNECTLEGKPFQPRSWAPVTYYWKATGLCHKPLYFEEVSLERYGHSWGPYVQPFVSGAHFFLTVPTLPYWMGLYPPGECVYTLGYYRPGSCAPYMLDPLPLSVRAGVMEMGVWTGMWLLIP